MNVLFIIVNRGLKFLNIIVLLSISFFIYINFRLMYSDVTMLGAYICIYYVFFVNEFFYFCIMSLFVLHENFLLRAYFV
jgi:hypothetical protein